MAGDDPLSVFATGQADPESGPAGNDPIAEVRLMPFNGAMDTPPEPPPSYEQVITKRLVECGLSKQGVKVSYEDDLQSYEIVIGRSANAAPVMFPCIRDAATAEIVTFDDHQLSIGYNAFLTELYRPEMLARAEEELAKRGLLTGFPRRADFASDALFAEALERHCGLAKGEAIRPLGDVLAFQPPPEAAHDFEAFSQRYSCLLSAIQLVSARDELTIGFIGNEAFASPD